MACCKEGIVETVMFSLQAPVRRGSATMLYSAWKLLLDESLCVFVPSSKSEYKDLENNASVVLME